MTAPLPQPAQAPVNALVAYDAVLFRPGCVLLQAAYGGMPEIASRFEPQDWLTSPTPDLKLYSVNATELELLLAITQAKRAKKTA